MTRGGVPSPMAGNPLASLGTPVPSLARISDYVGHYAGHHPHRAAARLGDRSLSYAELDGEVTKTARGMIAAGVVPGDRVAMLATPGPDFLIAFLATASIGGIWLGLNPKYTSRELDHVLGDARPRLLLGRGKIADRDYTDALTSVAGATGTRLFAYGDSPLENAESWHDWIARAAADADVAARTKGAQTEVSPADPCLLVYTSGSTGASKGALLTHRGLVKGACRRAAAWWHGPFRTLANLPVNHIGGVGDIVCTTLVTGGMLSFTERFDPGEAIALTERQALSFWYQIPTQLRMIVDCPAYAAANLSSLQAVIWSGARAPADLIEQLAARFPKRLGTDYSMTESIGAVTMTPLTGDLDLLGHSVGWPDPERQIRLGEDGEILLRDDAIMAGYLDNPEATSRAIDEDGWLHTNDVGEWRSDGSLTIVGRLNDMFKSGGYNIYPKEIESVLEGHPAIAQAAVVAVPDPLYAEVGMAFVTTRPGQAVAPDALLQWSRDQLANYKLPKLCVVLPELPLLPVGKIDKRTLMQRAIEAYTA